MKAAERNVRLEMRAFGLILVSLICLLGAVITTAVFVVNQMSNEPPIEDHGVVIGPKEALVGASCMIVPGIALVVAAWGLRARSAEGETEG